MLAICQSDGLPVGGGNDVPLPSGPAVALSSVVPHSAIFFRYPQGCVRASQAMVLERVSNLALSLPETGEEDRHGLLSLRIPGEVSDHAEGSGEHQGHAQQTQSRVRFRYCFALTPTENI